MRLGLQLPSYTFPGGTPQIGPRLTEIAQQLDLSKPTIKHHLAILRAAGLVTLTESGTVMYYSLRRDPLESSSADLERFLVGLHARGNKRTN